MRLTRSHLAAGVAALGLAAVPAYALAATSHGVTPASPKAGATVPKGKALAFKGKVRGKGSVFIHVCKSGKRNKRGVICATVDIAQAKKKNGRFSFTQKVFQYDDYWLNQPGTYFWQAHRIACEDGDATDCLQEGPVVRFKVG